MGIVTHATFLSEEEEITHLGENRTR
jgi:hypothetical protein